MLVPEILDVCDMNTNHTLRLIPEMTFTCNGTIVGFTVAGRQWTEGSVDPIVQIWRQNSSQNIYYRTSVDEIVVNKETCGETSTVSQGSSDNDQVWYCNLNATNRVPVQAGDILGLLLPPRNDSSFQLSFARVSRGPTNYVFEDQEVQAVDLCNKTGTKLNQEQPQIAVQVEPGLLYYS